MNPLRFDCTAYQELINDLFAGIAEEKLEENELFYELYDTTAELAKIDIQIRMSNPMNSTNGKRVQTSVLAIFA
eukprot:9190561-Ditylum_brightwellii.AAC.1